MKTLFFVLIASIAFASNPKETAQCDWIKDYITPVADFPKPGILFQWYANLLKEPAAFHRTTQVLADRYKEYSLDAIVALDSRGFVFGTALAYELNVPLVLVRKSGKLPRKVERIEYGLEYGKSSFEIEVDSLKLNDRVLIIDDVLATGGTAQAAVSLVERLGAKAVEMVCIIEIAALGGRNNVSIPVYSLFATED